TGVSLPLLGLFAMMLFQGDFRTFFNQTGRVTGWVILFVIQMILGPFGSLPRLITLAYATLKPYLPEFISLVGFSIVASALVVLFSLRKNKIVDLLGVILAPILLLSLGAILVLGLIHHPDPQVINATALSATMTGLSRGYNTLDMIASFIFAPLVFTYFRRDEGDENTPEGRKHIIKKMSISCLIAGGLLVIMFAGLTMLGSYYAHILPAHAPEERLGLIAMHLLGPAGALFSCVAIALSCLTTAIPIAAISAEYVQSEFIKRKVHPIIPISIPLAISIILANMGFMGIANMLSPILQILCPGLIILCILNIFYKLYEMRPRKTPVYAAFILSLIGYVAIRI
ncbi:MAG: branched-chain amino acid transport system II carrier protein, partial [Chlamydiales bacterium]